MLPQYSVEEWASRLIAKPTNSKDNCCRFVAKLDDERVVKFGCPQAYYSGAQNAAEALMWNSIKNTPAASFFAGVLESNKDGSWLIQEMAPGTISKHDPGVEERKNSSEKYGINDMAARQMGVHYLTGELVIRDYGINSTIDYGLRQAKAACGECIYCELYQLFEDMPEDEDDDEPQECNGDGWSGCESCNPCLNCDGCSRCDPHKSQCRCERCYPYIVRKNARKLEARNETYLHSNDCPTHGKRESVGRNVYEEIMNGQKFFSFINN